MQVSFLDGSSREVTLTPNADLRSANLSGAILRGANLRSADLRSADLCSANLCSADLGYADLRSAILRSAILRSANLSGADLRYADLCSADLRSAILRSANLSDADLSDADLRDANISGCTFPKDYRIARLDFGGWPVTVTATYTSIGCKIHPNARWLEWTAKDVAYMDVNAAKWWTQYGPAVCTVIRAVIT